MYYQARTHHRHPVTNAAEAATLIHQGKATSNHALCWASPIGALAAVADGHIDHPWFEVAVVNLTTRQQIESITFGWCKGLPEKIRHLQECERGDYAMHEPGTLVLPLDGEGRSVQAAFGCGCCGQSFRSTLREQARWDQDAGFGICPKCVGWQVAAAGG